MPTSDQSIRILIVDDDEDDFFIISDYIRGIHPNRFVLHWCFTYQEALTHMKDHNYDLYFVDYRLGVKIGTTEGGCKFSVRRTHCVAHGKRKLSRGYGSNASGSGRLSHQN